MKTICSIPSCQMAVSRRGWCESHYRRWVRYGDPSAGRLQNGTAEAFLHDIVLPCTGTECLSWPFQRTSNGYAKMWWDGGHRVVSRLACEMVHGPAPSPEFDAAHSCGNGHRGCVNPGHLSWKAKTDNAADKLVHGTHNRGERHGRAKLTSEDVHQIRAMLAECTRYKIARKFGVSETSIRRIENGEAWSWLAYRRDMKAAGRGRLLGG